MADDKDAKATKPAAEADEKPAKEEKPAKAAPKEEKPATKVEAKEEVKKEIPKKFEKLVKEIEELSVLELSELVTILEDHFNVSSAAPMTVAAASVAGGGDADGGGDEKSTFTVTLTDAGAQKVAAIKAVKEITGLGLGEAKALVDSVPSPVKEDVPKDEAEEAKSKLEEAGATAELN